MTTRRRLYEIMENAEEGDAPSLIFDWALSALIVANVLAVALETVPSVVARWGAALYAFEVFSVAVFTVEYALRLWVAVEDTRYRRPVLGRLRYTLSAPALVDLLAVAPFYLPFPVADLRFVRAFRLVRLLRVAKLGRYSEAMQTLSDVVRARKAELVSALAVFGVVWFAAAALLYFAENAAQPEVFSSIPDTLWIVIANFSGNGETPPVTTMGKVVAAVTSILSAGLFALPAGILASGFSERLAAQRRAESEASRGTYSEEDSDERL